MLNDPAEQVAGDDPDDVASELDVVEGWFDDARADLADGSTPPELDPFAEEEFADDDADGQVDAAALGTAVLQQADQDAPGQSDADDEAAAPAEDKPRPWDGVDPDSVDPEAMTDEEYAAFAAAHPAAARRMTLRWADYTRKNQARSEAEQKLAAERAEFEAQKAAFEAQRAQQTTAPSSQPPLDTSMIDPNAIYDGLRAQLGRTPTDIEYNAALVTELFRRQVEPEVKVIRQQMDEGQRRELAAKLDAEYNELVAAHPLAGTPEAFEAIKEYCSRLANIQPGDIKRAYYALYHEAEVQAQQAGKQRARRQQAQRAAASPAAPPGGAGPQVSGSGLPPTSDFSEIQRRQRARILSGEL